MFLAKIVFAAFTCVTLTNNVFVASQDAIPEEPEEEPPEEEKTPTPPDSHTFVALIDIVFTNGRKRSCTGTIIHDNVVITAAHCFADHNVYVEPELTASFVVIGTKKMYDTGYENYLPIERVVTHPKFKGWTADIALVYTFAGMTSDKPGNIMPLVGESSFTPVDSNVTILSWGHCKEEVYPEHTRAPVTSKKRICDSSEDVDKDSCEMKKTSKYLPLRKGISSTETDSNEQDPSPIKYGRQEKEAMQTQAIALKQATSKDNFKVQPHLVHKLMQYIVPGEDEETSAPASNTTKVVSRYLTSSETKEKNQENGNDKETHASFSPQKHRYVTTHRNVSDEDQNSMDVDRTRRKQKLVVKQGSGRKSFLNEEGDQIVKKEQTRPKENEFQTYFKNWRRQMGSKQNKLTVETFGFVNVQTCKKIIDKALPALYSINTNDVVCYAAEDHYISDDDSGAPVIRQGQLVAVTLGGAECEGDHVAVGVKMSCFCSWIAENLPDGGKHIKCCKDCCYGGHNGDKNIGLRQKNRYLYK